MSPQADYVVSNGTGAAVRSDINGQLAAIVSNNSGASAPATTYAYMLWADTSTNLLKLRNGANSAWITVGDLTAANLGLATLASPTFTGTATIPTLTVSTAANIPLGSAASPTLYFTGDSNTGLYSPGADQVALSTGGTGRLFIDSSGRCGIGTSSPGSILDIGSGAAAGSTITQITLKGGTGTGDYGIFSIQNGSTVKGRIVAGQGDDAFRFDTNGGASTKIQFKTGSSYTDALTIDASQRVGIGTQSPVNPLDVNGNISTNGAFYAYNSAKDGLGIWYNPGGAGVNQLTARLGGSDRLTIDSSGRLLVGTSSTRTVSFWDTPQVQIEGLDYQKSSLSIYNNQNEIYGAYLALGHSRGTSNGSNTIVQSNDYLGTVAFFGSDGSNEIRGAEISAFVDGTPGANDMPGRLVFSTTADGASSPTERMRITSDGYFKASNNSTYSTASPDYHQFNQSAASQWALGVFNRHASQPFGVTIQYLNATPNGTTNSFLLCGDATADRVQLRSNGGIANYSGNNVNLSDINTKKDISPAAGTWDCIKEWEIVNYRYKDQPDDADLNLGVIAQQVAESCPEVITVFQEAKEATEDQPAQEERLGVKEQQMYWMAIKALQEAQVRIEQLEATNADLLARVSALETA